MTKHDPKSIRPKTILSEKKENKPVGDGKFKQNYRNDSTTLENKI